MKIKPIIRSLAFLILSCLCLALSIEAQSALPSPTKQDDISLDVQLILLHASNEAAPAKGNTPSSIDPVIRQLKSTLPYMNYQPVMTFLNRVKNGGGLDLNGIGSFKVTVVPAEASGNNQSFYQYHISRVQVTRDSSDQPLIKIDGLRFGLKYPAITGTTTSDGKNYPVIQYQDMTVTTDVNAPVGAPTLVGTIGVNKPDETYVLILLIKEAMKGKPETVRLH